MLVSQSLRSRVPSLVKIVVPRTLATSGAQSTGSDPLQSDTRTTKPQQKAHDTDEATKESIRHASEGNFSAAVSDVGEMAKNAVKGAKDSAKLMYDSVKEKTTGQGANPNVKEDLKQRK